MFPSFHLPVSHRLWDYLSESATIPQCKIFLALDRTQADLTLGRETVTHCPSLVKKRVGEHVLDILFSHTLTYIFWEPERGNVGKQQQRSSERTGPPETTPRCHQPRPPRPRYQVVPIFTGHHLVFFLMIASCYLPPRRLNCSLSEFGTEVEPGFGNCSPQVLC